MGVLKEEDIRYICEGLNSEQEFKIYCSLMALKQMLKNSKSLIE
jgi:hypothetical protein